MKHNKYRLENVEPINIKISTVSVILCGSVSNV